MSRRSRGTISRSAGRRAPRDTGLVRALEVPDYVVALAEDAVAVWGAFLIVAASA